jgi:lipopolysaccharide export LptBFGC system permease protein LptF
MMFDFPFRFQTSRSRSMLSEALKRIEKAVNELGMYATPDFTDRRGLQMNTTHNQDTVPASAFYLSRWFAILPLGLFIFLTVALSLRGVFAAEGMVAMGLIGLILGSFFARK